MGMFDHEGSIKGFLIRYAIGMMAFVGMLYGLYSIFYDPDSVAVNADGSLELGLAGTYFDVMFTIGPEAMFIFMILSSYLVSLMTTTRKGIEAMILGLLCGIFIGFFISMNIEESLRTNLRESDLIEYSIEVKARARYASYLFLGNLFLWANFFLEIFRLDHDDLME